MNLGFAEKLLIPTSVVYDKGATLKHTLSLQNKSHLRPKLQLFQKIVQLTRIIKFLLSNF